MGRHSSARPSRENLVTLQTPTLPTSSTPTRVLFSWKQLVDGFDSSLCTPLQKTKRRKNQASKATETQLRSKNVKVTKGSKPSWVRCLSTLRQSMRNLDKIFGRYNRGSNVSGIVGTGVALYLVEIVAGLDHGRVTVESVDARGLLHRAPAAAARCRWRFRVRV